MNAREKIGGNKGKGMLIQSPRLNEYGVLMMTLGYERDPEQSKVVPQDLRVSPSAKIF